jgi:hypothetical protein
MKPVVEGHPYPISIETVETTLRGPGYITLRIGSHRRGQSQMTHFSLAETEVLAYALLHEVAERKLKIERLNDEARRHNEERLRLSEVEVA